MANTQSLLARLLNTPDLPAIVPRLPPEVLHRVIQTCGLEDCGEFVALATPAQLGRVFDLDLWRARTPGTEERFDSDRFGVWLEVLLDAGPDVAADTLAGLDLALVVGGIAQHIAVFDVVAATPYTMLDGQEMQAPMSGRTRAAEIGGYVIETRRASAWDAIHQLLAFLAEERPAYFHRLMRGCVRLSNGAHEEDASNDLLEDAEQHLFDLASRREGRREREGYVTPQQAHAFLRSARALKLDADAPERGPVARAYFRAFEPALPDGAATPAQAPEAAPVEMVLEVLREAGVLAPAPRALLEAGSLAPSRLAAIEAHVASHPECSEDLAYLANVIVAGCSVQGRRFTEREAGNGVAATCNLGLEHWPSGWGDRDLLIAFQIGWVVLQRDVCTYVSQRLVELLATIACTDREIVLGLDRLRRNLIRHLANAEPWRARDSLDVILALDPPAWAALLGLIDELPVLHAAIGASGRNDRTINPIDFAFVAGKADIEAVREFMQSLPSALA
jgi:hypothetical protein